jgi:transposase
MTRQDQSFHGQHFRGIATRYDKLARNFLAAIQLGAATMLLD